MANSPSNVEGNAAFPPTRRSEGRRLWLLAAGVGTAIAAAATGAARERTIPVSQIRVVAEFPHDPQAFTQGLVIHQGTLYEGTGLEGESSLRRVDLKSGRVKARMDLEKPYFGEGIAVLDGTIYQLTWRNRLAILYDLESMAFQRTIRYAGEGWGLTTDGKQLILSDGSATLKYLKPATFEVTRRLTVKAGKKPIDNLNELEYINGEIWANIWHSDRIARISPETGDVLGWIDLSALWPLKERPTKEYVLNGIAYDAAEKRIFVTGKNWPKLYEIELVK
jgi:glutamine cyclotransferase